VFRWCGRRGCLVMLVPVVLYFYLSGRTQRAASRNYLSRVLGRRAGWGDGFRHFMDFAERALDTLAAWLGTIPADAVDLSEAGLLDHIATEPRGGLLVVSHHGNAELVRALVKTELRDRLSVLVHTRHAENYNRILREFRPEAAARLIQVTDIGPDTAIHLKACVERGEWVAIAGDRVPVLSRDRSRDNRVSRVPFLGAPAAFSHGPWVLAAVLDCPVYLLFCRRTGSGRWQVSFERFAERIVLPRGDRAGALVAYIGRYAERLAAECRAAPWQWYNFFDFWRDAEEMDVKKTEPAP